ncbi:uncharacterized protein LOC131875984 [Cryptomeria japonica]|uniref:uncharacterized protein LOC131875984 n=1 Tax=Cryptomeria japonica TaxID=3369 RepID=UPI0027DA8F02|nr:uncharacterized protein LOC131875984 [Cryptomeria japonica]
MSIQMTPFRALYGYDAPNFIDLLMSDVRVPRAGDLLQESKDIVDALKDNMARAQNQYKQYVDRKRIERSFEVGDMVYLMLQPYRQSTLKKSGSEKLKPRYYGPFRIIRQVGEFAYELELPADSRVHNVFHVSRLKKALGQHVVPSTVLPPLDDEGKLILVLESILDSREKQLRRRVIREYLVKWRDLPVEDATWETEAILQHPALRLLEAKDVATEPPIENVTAETNAKVGNAETGREQQTEQTIDTGKIDSIGIGQPTENISEANTEKPVENAESQAEKPAMDTTEKSSEAPSEKPSAESTKK